jgi:hypothetical protein
VPGAGDGRVRGWTAARLRAGHAAPISDALYIFTPDKVVLLDVLLVAFLRAVSSWGLSLREMMVQGSPASGELQVPSR